ncbi:MAG: DUF3152 domain-containing protein [Candidatus Microthrix subdominans]|jgi:hypothetical protein
MARGTLGRLLSIVVALVTAVGAANVLGIAGPAGAQNQPSQETVALAIESRVDDVSTDELSVITMSTLNDPRGWGQAGFTFDVDPDSANRLVLAEPDVVDELCAPIETGGTLSCQNGPVVVLNVDGWRTAPEGWPDVETYRQFLVNHGVGHLISQFHPSNRCPVPGEPEALMAPQANGLEGCTANPWPLNWEVLLAVQRPVVLAPMPDVKPDAPSVNPGGGVVAAAEPAAPTTTTPPLTTEPDTTTPDEADAGAADVAETRSTQAGPTEDSSSGAPLLALGIVAALVLIGVALAVFWLRRRSKRAKVFDADDAAAVDLNDDVPDVFGDLTAVDPADGWNFAEVPLAEVEGGFDPAPVGVRPGWRPESGNGAELRPADRWHVRLSGRARREGSLLWLAPQRWEPGDVESFQHAIGGGVAGDGEALPHGAPADVDASRVGAALGEFLRRHPHLAPEDHEGLGLVMLDGDQVVAAVLGAAELVELRSGLAKPVRRQGILHLRHSAESPLEVELSVTPPARPRARIVVERSESA